MYESIIKTTSKKGGAGRKFKYPTLTMFLRANFLFACFLSLWTIPDGAQDLRLTPRVIPGGVWGPYGVSGLNLKLNLDQPCSNLDQLYPSQLSSMLSYATLWTQHYTISPSKTLSLEDPSISPQVFNTNSQELYNPCDRAGGGRESAPCPNWSYSTRRPEIAP